MSRGDETPTQGVKISQLNGIDRLSSNSLFVVVDIDADGHNITNQTKNVQYGVIVHYSNSGTNLSADNFQDAITEIDSIVTSVVGGVSGLAGGLPNQTLMKTTVADYDYSWGYISIGTGTTANRPATPVLGLPYFDTDLGYQINYNGTTWVNSTGATI